MGGYVTRGVGVVVTVAAVTLAGTGVAQAVPREGSGRGRAEGVVIGHRGSPGQAPEETAASYELALREDAEVLEGDVQLTKDGHLVLVHDDTLARTTDVEQVFPDRSPWTVGRFTLAEIKRLDAGSWFDARYRGQRVPTVRELLAINRGRAGLTLELKNPANSPGVGTRLGREVVAAGIADGGTLPSGAYRLHVHSRDEAALREFHAAAPEVQLSVLTGGRMPDDATLDAWAEWTVGVYTHPRVTTAADVQRAHDRKLKVISDPVDSTTEISMASNQGYDWLISNFPGVVNAVLVGRSPYRGNGVVVDGVFPNPSGDDHQPETGEHVVLRNTTDRPIDVGGGYLRDQAANLLRIGEGYVIPPGSLLRVYPGPGTNRPDAYYNGLPAGFLNNTGGETVSYFDSGHALRDIFSLVLPESASGA